LNWAADLQKDLIVPLARVVREHGFERSGVLTFKADLFSRGGLLLKDRLELWMRSDLSLKDSPQLSHSPSPSPFWKKVKLVASSAPHGGAWPQASGILIRVEKGSGVSRGDLIGLSRNEFPELSQGFYVCDLIGQGVEDENGLLLATVISFQDLAPGMKVSVVNLLAKSLDGKMEFSFPAQWIVGKGVSPASLRVDGVREWMLSGKERSDEPHETVNNDRETSQKSDTEDSDE
jgi:hypothetical protein